MPLVLTRIDNRLIHGQVLEAWVPHVKADRIIVANDEVAAEPLRRTLMQMAVPSHIPVQIVPVTEVAACLAGVPSGRSRTMLLFASTVDARRAFDLQTRFETLNLGNLHGGAGKVRVTCTICLDEGDLANLTYLEKQGVKVVAQCVPADREQPLSALRRCSLEGA